MAADDIGVVIRRCGADDAAALAAVSAATFMETYAGLLDGRAMLAHCDRHFTVERYASALSDAGYAFWLAEAVPGCAPVGFAMLSPPDLPSVKTFDDDIELKRIYLLHRFHGGGHGAALMGAAIEEARRRGAGRLLLGVYKKNPRALAFYGRQGFEPIGDRLFRVGDTDYEDAVLAKVL